MTLAAGDRALGHDWTVLGGDPGAQHGAFIAVPLIGGVLLQWVAQASNDAHLYRLWRSSGSRSSAAPDPAAGRSVHWGHLPAIFAPAP